VVRVLGIALVLLSLALAACGSTDSAGPSSGSSTAASASKLRTMTIETSGGREVKVRVEIADDPAEQERGLMYRTALAEDRGMLFVFDREQRLAFWMKNTLIPLSIAYIDSEKRIVDIQDMKPLDDDPPNYVSAKPARYALEVNQGFFEKRGVKVGDKVKLPSPEEAR
jgi:uncharacterized protein